MYESAPQARHTRVSYADLLSIRDAHPPRLKFQLVRGRGGGLLRPRRASQCGREQVGVEDDESADLDDKTQNYSYEARRYVQESLITLELFWLVISCDVPSYALVTYRQHLVH